MTAPDRRRTARDGGPIRYYETTSPSPKGGLLLLGETFGLNRQIRRTADAFAAEGFRVLAPQMLERAAPGVEFDRYDADTLVLSRRLRAQLDPGRLMADLAELAELAARSGPLGVVGYSWGGLLAYQAAAEIRALRAAVSYYGTGTAEALDARPRPPLQFHLGETDSLVPAADIARIGEATGAEMHLYAAPHGFACDERLSFHPESARLARARTLAFLEDHLH